MNPLVIDASGRLDTLTRTELTGEIFARFDVCAPTLIRWELGQVIHRKTPKTFGDRKARSAILATLLKPLRLEPQAGREDAIADLVATHSLSYYDAAYLQLALDEDAGIITHDRALSAAARKALRGRPVWTLDEIDFSQA